jgi:hypothetical protein
MPTARPLAALTCASLIASFTALADAQSVADHLKCYKVKDPQAKATYTADLGGLVAEPSCTIKVPAIMACVPATKTNVTPPPPGGGPSGTPNSFFCYKVKCPKATFPTLPGADQFGSRTVTPKTVSLLCAPVVPTPRFVDNGDGTVTDHQTGLQWEKKVFGVCSGANVACTSNADCTNFGGTCQSCLHCVNDTYVWSNSGTAPDGPAFTSFLGTLNNCTSTDGTAVTNAGFAGHCDWRLPTIQELQTILLAPSPCGTIPCVDPIFGPTQTGRYWSSTTFDLSPSAAWHVHFINGIVSNGNKGVNLSIRAVRGGS